MWHWRRRRWLLIAVEPIKDWLECAIGGEVVAGLRRHAGEHATEQSDLGCTVNHCLHSSLIGDHILDLKLAEGAG